MLRPRFATMLALLATAFCATTARAQTFTQPAAGTTGSWSNAAFWTPLVPVSGTTTALTFNTFGGNGNPFNFTNDLGAFTANSFTLNNYGIGTLTLTSTTTLTFGGTNPFLTLNSFGGNTIASAVSLGAATTINGSGTGFLSFTGIISGAGGLIISQTGNSIISLTAANTFTGNVILNSGYLQIGTSATALGAAANTLTINGGAVRYSSGGTFANTIILNNADYVVAGGTGGITGQSSPTVGPVTGNGGVTIQTTGSSAGPTMSSVNTYNGATLIKSFLPNANAVTGPLITLSGANGSALNSPSFTVANLGTLVLGGTTANGNRIADNAAVNLLGGRLTYNPVTAGTNETFGDLTISGTAHFAGTPIGVNTMTAGNFIRNGNATIIIDTATYGTIQSAVTANKLVFTGSNPAADVFAVGSGTGTQTGVLPYAVGGSTSNPSHFVTYDATNGLSIILRTDATRVVQQAPGAMVAATLLNNNVNFTGNGTYTFTGPYTINALSTTSSTVTFAGTGTLTVASGTLVNFDNFTINGPTIDFGANKGYWFNSFPVTVTGTSAVTGSNGLVVSSGTATAFNFQNTVANPFTGGLTLNGAVNLGYTNDNQLGDASGSITLAGGNLVYNAAASYTMTRDITIEETDGGFAFNRNNTTAAIGTATATTTVTLAGQITGAGAFRKDGVGIVNLTNAGNSYAGGTILFAGTLQYTADSNLGAANSRIILSGGTLQALATVTSSRPMQVNTSSGLNAGAGVVATYSGAFNNIGAIYGTMLPSLAISGAGTVVLTGNSPLMTGNIAIAAGSTLRVADGGKLPNISTINIPATARLDIDDTTYTAGRFGNFTGLNLSGGLINYLAGATATGDPAQRFGNLTVTASGSVLNIDAGAATSSSVLRFNSLILTSGNLTLRGTGLGDVAGNVGRIFFDNFTTNQSVIPNVFYDGTSGTGTSLLPAGYDLVRGIIAFAPTPVSGTNINNYNTPTPDNVPLTAAFTTTGDATAITGVQIYSLTLDLGNTLTLTTGTNGPDATNGNTPLGTLSLAGGFLTSQTSAKTITSDAARTITFGASAALVTTTTDLTADANVTFTGTGGLTKAGAGVLTINGTYSVTGALAINAGTVALVSGSTVGTLSGTGTLSVPGTVTVNQTAASTFAGTLSGVTNFVKSGTGTLTLSPAGAVTAAVTFANGTLVVGNVAAVVAVDSGTLAFGAAANTSGILDLNAFSLINPVTALTVTGTGTNHQIINNNLSGLSTIALNLPANQTIPISFGGAITVNKTDATTLILTGTTVATPSVIGGVFNVNAGTLQLNAGSQGLTNGMSVAVASGATFNLTATAGTSNSGNIFRTVTVAAGGTWNNNGANFFDTFIGNYIFEGGATINSTAAGIGSFYHLITVNSVLPTIVSTAGSTTTNFITTNTSDHIQNDSASPLVINVAQGTTPSGVDINFGIRFNAGTTTSVSKTGPGTMALSGLASASTYAFAVNGGRLLINSTGSGTGALTVNATGTLAGTGSTTAAITVNSGGTLRGGDGSAGTLAIGNVTFVSGASLGVSVTDGSVVSSGTPGSSTVGVLPAPTSNTFLNKTAGTVTGLNLVNISADLLPALGTLVLGSPYSFTVGQGFGDQSTLNINDPARFSFPNFPVLVNSPSLTGDVGGFIYLNFTPVIPEPGLMLGLAGLGVVAAAIRRRRR